MDTVTHLAMGATIGAAVGEKRLGWRALVAGAVCGIFPDIDYASFIFGEWTGIQYHRAVLHTLLFWPLWGLALGWAAWRVFKRRGSYWRWAAIALLAMLSHPLLDWQTSWGTQLFWPLTNHRYFTDAVALIDPLVTVWLLAAVVLGIIYRNRHRDIAAWSARAAIVIVVAYLVGGYYNSVRVEEDTRAMLPADFEPAAFRTLPTLGNIWLWRVVARDQQGNLRVGLYSLADPSPVAWKEVPMPDPQRLRELIHTERGRIFYWFADHWVSLSTEDPHFHGHDVCLADQRYGGIYHPEHAMWGACADIKAGGQVADFSYADFQVGRIQVAEHFEQILEMIFHGTTAPNLKDPSE